MSKREREREGKAAPKKGKHFTYCYPGYINKAAALQEQLKKKQKWGTANANANKQAQKALNCINLSS